MRGTRQSSSVSSYKSTIGFSVLKLLLMTTVVGLCITKIIVGGEFISECRSEPLLPVYVVISGCLPVFLSPLRGSSFTGHGQHADKHCRLSTYHTAVLVFGVIVNLSWLVFGTILLSKVFMNRHRFTPECDVNKTSNSSDSLLTHGHSEDGTRTDNETSLNNLVNQMDHNEHLVKGKGNDSFTERTTVRPPADAVQTSDSRYSSTPSDVPLLEKNTLTSHTITSNNSKPSVKSFDATISKPTANHAAKQPIFSNKSVHLGPPHSTSQTTSRSSVCFMCTNSLIMFTLVITIVDWILMLLGIVIAIRVLVTCCEMPTFKELVPFLGKV